MTTSFIPLTKRYGSEWKLQLGNDWVKEKVLITNKVPWDKPCR